MVFQTWPGHTYRVEFKNDLLAPAWTALTADLFATENQLNITDPAPAAAQRYYRIVQVN